MHEDGGTEALRLWSRGTRGSWRGGHLPAVPKATPAAHQEALLALSLLCLLAYLQQVNCFHPLPISTKEAHSSWQRSWNHLLGWATCWAAPTIARPTPSPLPMQSPSSPGLRRFFLVLQPSSSLRMEALVSLQGLFSEGKNGSCTIDLERLLHMGTVLLRIISIAPGHLKRISILPAQ